jgi:hypothetical protein
VERRLRRSCNLQAGTTLESSTHKWCQCLMVDANLTVGVIILHASVLQVSMHKEISRKKEALESKGCVDR